jgi:hypothetical protein
VYKDLGEKERKASSFPGGKERGVFWFSKSRNIKDIEKKKEIAKFHYFNPRYKGLLSVQGLAIH